MSEEPITIPVTQFMLPHGRREVHSIQIPRELEAQWVLVQKCGCRLTAEILTTGDVSVCIEEPRLGDFDIRIGHNSAGPHSPVENIKELLKKFDEEKFKAWKKNLGDDDETFDHS